MKSGPIESRDESGDMKMTEFIPEQRHYVKAHPIIELTFQFIWDEYEYDISVLEKEQQDRLFTVTLDAEPHGTDAMRDSVCAAMRSIALESGWIDGLVLGLWYE
jgi:hypothetical protein